MQKQWDLIIIGAGPAGMTAALTAAGNGLSVLVLDRQASPGGQIFNGAAHASEAHRKSLGKDYMQGAALVDKFLQSGITFWGNANVWHLVPNAVYVSYKGESLALNTRQTLIATGGMERPAPIVGWTQAGVVGAGAADVLLKSSQLVPQGPVVVCGNGPLILQTVVHLIEKSIPIAGIVFTGSLANMGKGVTQGLRALYRPSYFIQGFGMILRILAAHPKIFFGAKPLAITKNDEKFRVTFAHGGKEKSLLGKTVLLHEGVVSESQITRLAKCRHTWNPKQLYWHVDADKWGQTTVQGIRVAGDCAGVYGAAIAIQQGEVVALDICRELGVLSMAERDEKVKGKLCRLARLKAMQPLLDVVFNPNPECLQPSDESIVCRCEELTGKDIKEMIAQGCYSLDGLKAQSRAGMGSCQGRMCAASAANMIAQVQGIPLERLQPYNAQPPLFPISLGELADMSLPPQGL